MNNGMKLSGKHVKGQKIMNDSDKLLTVLVCFVVFMITLMTIRDFIS